MPKVTVVGLGPGPADLVTAGTVAAIDRTPPAARFLRTARHPSATVVGDAVTAFDSLYEAHGTFDEVYAAIVDALAEAARDAGEVLYAVPGSPFVLERSVELLRRDPRVEVTVVPAMSFLDLAWARLGVDPLADGVRLVDGHQFELQAAGERGPLLIAHCHNRRVLSDVKLAYEIDTPREAVVLQRLGLPDESIFTVAWEELDRSFEPDHLTALYVAAAAPPVARELQRFALLVQRLRADCPWDREQTHQSLTRHLIEEAYEVVDAIGVIDRDGYDHLCEELGDLLFQVFFHATIAAEGGAFTLADVAQGIHDKLVRRHPHVFGDATGQAVEAADVMANWELDKRAEKGRASVFDGIPSGLPALLYAYEILRKAGAAGLDVPMPAGGLGAALFDLVARARAEGIDPESALRESASKYQEAARRLEG